MTKGLTSQPKHTGAGTRSVEHHEPMPILDHLANLNCKERTHVPVQIRLVNRILMGLFVFLVLALLFLPWQQFVQGLGKVIAYDPMERSVVVEAPLQGRVEGVHVVEGQAVSKGEVLFKITDNDPSLMENLQRQLGNIEQQRQAATSRIERLKAQLVQTEESLPQAVEMAQKQLEAARFAQKAADLQFERIRALYEDPRGLASQRDFELATMSRDSRRAETLRAEAALIKTKLDMTASIESMQASLDNARGDLNKVEREWTDLQIKINQTGRQLVVSPRDGYVIRLQVNEGTFLKTGSPLCTVIPETDNFVVELWVDGNDMPLIQERVLSPSGEILKYGSPVRLQFEGWPAIQFVGWPSVAIGTFGGEVIFVDKADNGQGKFRVLVAPDPDIIPGQGNEKQVINWPESPVMRQGILAQGWVLLERVPLWFEIWRQMNGFPPSLNKDNPIRKNADKS